MMVWGKTSPTLWLMVTLICYIIQGELCLPIMIDIITESEADFLAAQRSLQMFNDTSFSTGSRKIANTTDKDLYKYVESLLEHDVAVIIEGMSTSKLCHYASMVTNIPLIRTHGRVNRGSKSTDPHSRQYSFTLNAGYQSYAAAVVSVLETFGWDSITLIYDTSRFHEAAFFSSLSIIRKYQIQFINVYASQTNCEEQKSDENIYRIVKQVQQFSSQIQLLFVDLKIMGKILEKELPCHTNQTNTIWIISGEAPINLPALSSHIVVGFRQSLNDKAAAMDLVSHIRKGLGRQGKQTLEGVEENEALVFDAVLVAMHAIKKQIEDGFWNRGNSSWIVKKRGAILQKYISQINTRGLTGSIRFDEKGRRKDVQFDVLNLRNNSFVKIGSFDGNEPTYKRLNLTASFKNNKQASQTRFQRLEGSKLRVVTVLETPFVMKTRQPDGSYVYEGYAIDLLNEIAYKHKFTYEIYESPDGMYGAEMNRIWNGVIKELLKGNADIAVTSLTITEAREVAVDFTTSYEYYTQDLLIKKQKQKELDLVLFLSPFTPQIWTALVIVLFVVTIALFCVNYWSPYGMKNERETGTAPEFSFSNCMWFSVACMLQQGAEYHPKSNSARMLVSSFWFYILLCVATYTAHLTATFTVDQSYHPIKNLEEAIDSEQKFTFLNGSNLYSLFRDTDFPLYKKNQLPGIPSHGLKWAQQTAKIWERKIISSSSADAVKLVRQNNVIYISDGAVLEYIAKRHPCDLYTGLTTPEGMGFALRSGDPRRDNITLSILHLRDNGHMSKLKRKWWLLRYQCNDQIQAIFNQRQITLDKMLGVFAVLGIGIFVSFVVLGIEILWYKRKSSSFPLRAESAGPATDNKE